MAAVLGGELTEVHRDDRSILLLRGEASEWIGDTTRGYCWSPGSTVKDGIRSWRDASRRGAPGLVIDRPLRGLHSSVCGLEPLYWMRDGDAVYFCTRIHPLVATAPHSLSVDWEAWAQIILFGYPLAPSTPFVEVRRLEPFTLLGEEGHGVTTTVDEWPWLDAGSRSSDEVAGMVVEEARASVASVDGRRIVCPLSGGWDSRLLLSLLAERNGSYLSAWTIEPDSGDANEAAFARAVADRLGVQHSTAEASPRNYWEYVYRCAELTDYQCSIHGWMLPLIERLGAEDGTIVDGIGGDIWIKGLFLTDAIVHAPASEEAFSLLRGRLARERTASKLFRRRPLGGLLSSARAGFDRSTQRFRDHPAGPSLAAFRTRTACGVSHAPESLFGAIRPVATPLITDGLIQAAIAAPPVDKLHGALYAKVLERVDRSVARLPSTNDPGYKKRSNGRHWATPRARRGYIEALCRSPLRPWFSDDLETALAAGSLRQIPVPGKARMLAAVATFEPWERRYRHCLRDVDPSELLD
jgi:hypothetical protein